MTPHTLRFITTIDIDPIGYQELLKQGYSENQINTFIKQKINFAFDLKKLGIASSGISLESDDDYTIIRKPLPINYSNVTSEDLSSVRTIKREPVAQKEW